MGFPKQYPKTASGLDNEWLIFFISVPVKRWINKIGLTRPGFEHCLGVQYCPQHDRWVMLDWNYCGADIVMLDELDLHHLFLWAAQFDATVVNYKSPRLDYQEKITRMLPMNCVISMLHALKLNTRWIYTPFQLYKHLMKSGATIVRGESHG